MLGVSLALSSARRRGTIIINLSGFTIYYPGGQGASSGVESPLGTLTLTGDGTNLVQAEIVLTTIPNRTYYIKQTGATAACTVCAGIVSLGNNLLNASVTAGATTEFSFVPTLTTTYLSYKRQSAATSVVSAITLRT